MTASGDVITGAAFDRADNPNCCIALRSATQNIATGGVGSLISFDAEEFDNSAMFTPTSTNITIQSDGVYLVTCYVEWQVNGAGYRAVDIFLNGVTASSLTANPVTVSATTRMVATNQFLLSALDVVTFNLFQTSTVTLTAVARAGVTRISG